MYWEPPTEISPLLIFAFQARSVRKEILSSSAKAVLLPATVAESYLKSLRRHRYDLFSPSLKKHTEGLMLPKLQLLIKFRSFLRRY